MKISTGILLAAFSITIIGSFAMVAKYIDDTLVEAKSQRHRRSRSLILNEPTGISNIQPSSVPVPVPDSTSNIITIPTIVIEGERPPKTNPVNTLPVKAASSSPNRNLQWICKPSRNLEMGSGSVKECGWE
jgi:hypothetical protein